MTVRVNKSAFSIREKLSELERPIGVKGNELIRAETAQDARDLVSAGRKNIVYNGNMEIAQRGTSFASLSSGTNHTLDGMRMVFSGGNGGTWTVSQESDAPPGFQKSIKALCTSGYTDTTTNYVSFAHRIEGYNLNHLAYGTSSAKPITISFWVKCSKAGPHLVFEIFKGRNFTRLININQADTWEYKTETVDGDTAAAFLNTTNSVGAYVNFFFGLGTNYKASAMNTSWSGYSSGARGYGLVNLNQTNDYIQITGFQIEVGKNATEFEHRSYGEELALCQRYFVKYYPSNQEWVYVEGGGATNQRWWFCPIPPGMRAQPGVNFAGTWTGSIFGGNSITAVANGGPENGSGAGYGRLSVRVTTNNTNYTSNSIVHTDAWAGGNAYVEFASEL